MKKNIIVYGIIIVIILFIIAFIIVRNTSKQDNSFGNKYIYQGRTDNFTFQVVQYPDFKAQMLYLYVTQNNKFTLKQLPFDYTPYELSSYSIENGIENKILGTTNMKKTLYITQDLDLADKTSSYSMLASAEIAKVTGIADYSVFMMNTNSAFTSNNGNLSPGSIVTCDSANSKIAVIYLKLGDGDKIYSDGECVIVQSKNPKDIKKLATALIYRLVGVF